MQTDQAEPQLLGESPDSAYESFELDASFPTEDEPLRYTQRDHDRGIAAVRRRLDNRYKGRIAELEARIAELEKGPAVEAMSREAWAKRLDQEMTLAEYERLAGAQLKQTLRQWLATDPRVRRG